MNGGDDSLPSPKPLSALQKRRRGEDYSEDVSSSRCFEDNSSQIMMHDDDDAGDSDLIMHSAQQEEGMGEEEEEEVCQRFKRIRIPGETVCLRVQTLSGKQMFITLNQDDTIAKVKSGVEEKEGIPVAQQRLVHRGKVVNDAVTLKEGKIEDGDTIHLVLALRGGRTAR